MSFLDWNDDFVFKLQVDRIPSVCPEASGTLLQELSLCQLVPWLPEGAINIPIPLLFLLDEEQHHLALPALIPASSNRVKSGQESDLELGNDSEDLIRGTISGQDSAPETQGKRGSSCYLPFQQQPNNSLNPNFGWLCYPFGKGNKNNITEPAAAP